MISIDAPARHFQSKRDTNVIGIDDDLLEGVECKARHFRCPSSSLDPRHRGHSRILSREGEKELFFAKSMWAFLQPLDPPSSKIQTLI